MERIVIVGYRPYPGKETALLALVKTHYRRLKTEDLVTDRQPVAMVAGDGTILEVFGWKSAKAMQTAHHNPAVQAMWAEFDAVCNYVPAGEIAEMKNIFSEFSPAF